MKPESYRLATLWIVVKPVEKWLNPYRTSPTYVAHMSQAAANILDPWTRPPHALKIRQTHNTSFFSPHSTPSLVSTPLPPPSLSLSLSLGGRSHILGHQTLSAVQCAFPYNYHPLPMVYIYTYIFLGERNERGEREERERERGEREERERDFGFFLPTSRGGVFSSLRQCWHFFHRAGTWWVEKGEKELERRERERGHFNFTISWGGKFWRKVKSYERTAELGTFYPQSN